MTKGKLISTLIALNAFLVFSLAAYAQLPSAAKVVPAGFKVTAERDIGGATMVISAVKPNTNFPPPHTDQGISLEISWMRQPMADQILDMLGKQPEEPAADSPGTVAREEPCGKRPYNGGILSCRKVITPWTEEGEGPDLVTWRIIWTGKDAEGIVGISIGNFYGSKETIMGWIDSIIPKIAKEK